MLHMSCKGMHIRSGEINCCKLCCIWQTVAERCIQMYEAINYFDCLMWFHPLWKETRNICIVTTFCMSLHARPEESRTPAAQRHVLRHPEDQLQRGCQRHLRESCSEGDQSESLHWGRGEGRSSSSTFIHISVLIMLSVLRNSSTTHHTANVCQL